MRFDDMLSTVFAQTAESVVADDGAFIAAWMQTVDILAQGRESTNRDQRAEAFKRLAKFRKHVPVDRRRIISATLASRPLPLDIVTFFASDAPVVAAPLITSVQLSDFQWKEILPKLPAATRALVRERRDLGGEVRAMLAGFGRSDRALPAMVTSANVTGVASEPKKIVTATDTSPEGRNQYAESTQISELVSRIEQYRREREALREAEATKPISIFPVPADGYKFETGIDGIIIWAEGISKEGLIGISLSSIALAGECGVDGHAAGAFKKRTPFRDARLITPGSGPNSGVWLISGTPWFNADDGRFQGYRCTARRPLREENLAMPNAGLLGDGLPPDSVRQLVHELRTPLNAIRGFAEMITAQLLGPVQAPYRAKAQNVIDDARRLLSLFDDLDAAARLDSVSLSHPPSVPTDARRLLHGVAANLVGLTDAGNVHLRISSGHGDAGLAVDAVSVERMYTRLLATMVSLAGSGETLNALLVHEAEGVKLSVDRPASLNGLTNDQLFDPNYGPAGEWPDAPALGLGFTLRLLSNLARSVNGRFSILPNEMCLFLPSAHSTATQEIV